MTDTFSRPVKLLIKSRASRPLSPLVRHMSARNKSLMNGRILTALLEETTIHKFHKMQLSRCAAAINST